MTKILIKLDSMDNKDKVMDAIRMLKGVSKVTIADPQDHEERISAKKMSRGNEPSAASVELKKRAVKSAKDTSQIFTCFHHRRVFSNERLKISCG